MRDKAGLVTLLGVSPGLASLAVTEERTVGPFSGIDLRGSETVHVSAGSPPSLAVRASAGTVSEVVTEVENGVLVIREKKPASIPRSIDVYAVVEYLESLAVSGSGNGNVAYKATRKLRNA